MYTDNNINLEQGYGSDITSIEEEPELEEPLEIMDLPPEIIIDILRRDPNLYLTTGQLSHYYRDLTNKWYFRKYCQQPILQRDLYKYLRTFPSKVGFFHKSTELGDSLLISSQNLSPSLSSSGRSNIPVSPSLSIRNLSHPANKGPQFSFQRLHVDISQYSDVDLDLYYVSIKQGETSLNRLEDILSFTNVYQRQKYEIDLNTQYQIYLRRSRCQEISLEEQNQNYAKDRVLKRFDLTIGNLKDLPTKLLEYLLVQAYTIGLPFQKIVQRFNGSYNFEKYEVMVDQLAIQIREAIINLS